MKIGIIGGGIIGLSCGVKLIEYFLHNVDITIISENLSPNTTGDIAAGLWSPYLAGKTPLAKLSQWSKETFNFFHNLWKNGDANEVGISLLPLISLSADGEDEIIPMPDIVYGYEKLTDIELEKYSREHQNKYIDGVRFVTFTCETTPLLAFLMKRYLNAGGNIKRMRVENFDELLNDNYDLIINCTGIGAKTLIKNDNSLIPIRGQVIRVNAPWISTIISIDHHYIIPNLRSVVLGGTHQYNNYNTGISVKDRESILSGCNKLIPSLKSADILYEITGLRPGRSTVRLDDEIYEGKNGTWVKIIHNYGHGGSGITFFWGCASDVLELVIKSFNFEKTTKCKL